MQISSRFTIAIHILLCIKTFQEEHKVTSDLLASSVNTNPVIIRRLLQQLKQAGLVHVARGTGGASLAKPVESITLLDVYHAVACVDDGKLFHFHENPNPDCPIGRSIHAILDDRLEKIQSVMEEELRSVTIEDLLMPAQKAPCTPP